MSLKAGPFKTGRLAAVLLAPVLLAACANSTPGPETPAAQTQAQLPPDSLYVDPAAAGWNAAALSETVAYVQSQKTTGFLVIDNGRILAEHNWPLPAGAETFATNFTHGTSSDGALIEDVASAQKSFIALLVGVAVDKGQLDIAKPVTSYLGAGWSKSSPAQEAAITVRQLLEMTSGLKENLTYEAPAGSKFFYNTPAYAKLKPVLEKASGQSLDAISRDWIIAPAGLKDTSWAKRPAAFADVGNPTGLATTPRDLARLGQLILDRGQAENGTQVISPAQLFALFRPTATNPAYGRLWWLNGGAWSMAAVGDKRTEGPLIPAAPSDLIAAQGAQDRKLYVSPSKRLIVVRTGQAAPDRDFNQQLWTRLAQAMPKK